MCLVSALGADECVCKWMEGLADRPVLPFEGIDDDGACSYPIPSETVWQGAHQDARVVNAWNGYLCVILCVEMQAPPREQVAVVVGQEQVTSLFLDGCVKRFVHHFVSSHVVRRRIQYFGEAPDDGAE